MLAAPGRHHTPFAALAATAQLLGAGPRALLAAAAPPLCRASRLWRFGSPPDPRPTVQHGETHPLLLKAIERLNALTDSSSNDIWSEFAAFAVSKAEWNKDHY